MLVKQIYQSIFTSWVHLGIILSLGVITGNSTSLLAAPLSELDTDYNQSELLAQTSTANSTLADGVYLYGQSAQPEEIGSEYLVFSVNQGKVIGASYLPYSEFACFYGNVTASQMNLSLIDPYDPEQVYPVSIALEELSPVAATGDRLQRHVGLEGYHRLDKLSENDQRILNTCQQNQ